jgi:hypothetical protein
MPVVSPLRVMTAGRRRPLAAAGHGAHHGAVVGRLKILMLTHGQVA